MYRQSVASVFTVFPSGDKFQKTKLPDRCCWESFLYTVNYSAIECRGVRNYGLTLISLKI